ncbi:SDR family oxidoreductase [Nocardioides mangrovicus]|uniref:SDR family oxidoreductase n=1 Tax=Nocardioides mangrovicus TaxID=2478913 RepID=A0A3L8P3L0_9ACTN|nr:SDR family oxidoreductase [Nocardioides mangrovicus]RLV49986.1 SDR family oxidoreductase [Nocardioides mangrovicus]
MAESRVAVVTGGAGAIGGAIVTALRESGHRVVVLDRHGVDGVDGMDGVDGVDLADADAVRAAADDVLARHGRVDVLVHAAADLSQAALADVGLDLWRRVQAVNVEALLLLAQTFAPGMAAAGFGRIVPVVSDTVWSPPAPELLAYVTSKAAVVGMTRSLAHALGGDGVAVVAVAPGLTPTPAAREGMPAEAFTDVVRRQALARELDVTDVAASVAFLAGPGGAALTGQVLCVDGGLVLR